MDCAPWSCLTARKLVGRCVGVTGSCQHSCLVKWAELPSAFSTQSDSSYTHIYSLESWMSGDFAESATSVRQVAAPGPGIGAKCTNTMLGPVRKDSNRCSWTLPAERPRKQISPDRYGLFHQVAGGLRPSEPGGLHSNGSSSYQTLLPFRHTAGVTQ
jgi:hypothetical protein